MSRLEGIMKYMLCLLAVFALGMTSMASEGITNLRSGSEWKGSVFGDVGGEGAINSNNFKIAENVDSSVDISVSGNRGKIAGGSDGMVYYYKELEVDTNFTLTGTIHINSYANNNQVSFGAMVRDDVPQYEANNRYSGDYIAAGAIDLAREGNFSISRKNRRLTRTGKFAGNPMAGTSMDVSIVRSGATYEITVGNEEPIVMDNFDFSGDKVYVGFYAVRNASITVKDIQLDVDTREVENLQVSGLSKKNYLPGEKLDLTGLEVTADYKDGTKVILTREDFIVSGFDSSEVGDNTIYINHNEGREAISLNIVPLSISKLNVNFYPVKTEYYMDDTFDSLGLEVEADYNDGYMYKELSEEDYAISINGKTVDEDNPFVFERRGEYRVSVISTENKDAVGDFTIDVSDAKLRKVEVEALPEVTQYFLGDELDLDGMVVYAIYNDGSKVRLSRDEYEVSGFSSERTGNKRLKISHKNKSERFRVNVKKRESQGLNITRYPRTTFPTGMDLNLDEMVVMELFDNSDLEEVAGLSIDTTGVDMDTPGVYDIRLSAERIEDTTLKVTVRDEKEREWKNIVFGQSISTTRNFIKDKGDIVEITALEGGGKITGDHDGISFHYVELDASENFVLSADIKVSAYAKTPHDGQESFGIMARDAIGADYDSSVFASNIAAVGGHSGSTRTANGTQLFVRSGVEAPNGEGSLGVQRVMIKEERPDSSNTPYRLTLAKTNSGFTGRIDNGDEVIIFEPEILGMQNDKMYVGFYSARLAIIEVSNIDLAVSVASTDAPKVAKPIEAATPQIEVESLKNTSESQYVLRVRPSVDGVISVKRGREAITSEVPVEAGKLVEIETELEEGNTRFGIVMIPDDTQLLTSYATVAENFSVEMRSYRNGKDIYVSPEGTADGKGTRENPLDFDTAIHFVLPGQKIVVLDGIYTRHQGLEIFKYNDGREDARKYLVADEGTRPVMDFDRIGSGMIHSGDYWHVYGIDFVRSRGNQKGYTVGGNHNIIEVCRFYENGDTGFQISRTDFGNSIEEWPSYNMVLNSDSFNNVDPSENNADGFGAKLTSGAGNIFDGCMAYNNIDDGWDLYTKVGSGAIGPVVIRNSIAFNNGYTIGNKPGGGDGNGFKLGGEGVHVPHLIENSAAFGNIANGYSSNSNPGVIAKDNISFNNHRNALFVTYTDIEEDFQIDGFVSLHVDNDLEEIRDNIPDENHSAANFFFDGVSSKNIDGDIVGKKLMPQNLVSEVPSRRKDGSIDFDFFRSK